MKPSRWRLFMAVVGAGAYSVCSVHLGYPWQFALLTSLAVVALAYSARRTYHEQRRLLRGPSWDYEDSAPSDSPDGPKGPGSSPNSPP